MFLILGAGRGEVHSDSYDGVTVSSKTLSDFPALHGAHAVVRFDMVDFPPIAIGTT